MGIWYRLTHLQCSVVDIISEGLHHVRAAPWVRYLGDAGLLLDDDLGVAGDAGTLDGGKAQRLIKGVGVEGLGAAEHGRHGLDDRADHVVVWVLRRDKVSCNCNINTIQYLRNSH